MKTVIQRTIPFIVMATLLISCGSEQQSQGSQGNYKDIKTMVLDILKTEDGQKAVKEATEKGGEAASEQLQILSTGQGKQLQMAVKDVLTDPSYPKVLENMMKDPKFAGEFAKSIQDGNKQLHKDLMKDPEYQKQMLDLMKNPEFEKMLIDTLKGRQYRQQSMAIIQESMQSPLFRVEVMQLMKKVMEEEAKPKGEIETESKEDEKEDKQDEEKQDEEKQGEKKQDEEKKKKKEEE